MNRWECQHDGCTVTAIGIGGARGLRAIGWHFHRGPTILCPAHHPAGIEAAELQVEAIAAWLERGVSAPTG